MAMTYEEFVLSLLYLLFLLTSGVLILELPVPDEEETLRVTVDRKGLDSNEVSSDESEIEPYKADCMECDETIDWSITQKHYENGEIHLCSACEKLRDDMLNEQVEKDMYESSASSKETNESSEEVKDFLDKLNEYYKQLQKSNISAKFHIEYSESTPSS